MLCDLWPLSNLSGTSPREKEYSGKAFNSSRGLVMELPVSPWLENASGGSKHFHMRQVNAKPPVKILSTLFRPLGGDCKTSYWILRFPPAPCLCGLDSLHWLQVPLPTISNITHNPPVMWPLRCLGCCGPFRCVFSISHCRDGVQLCV